MVSKHISFSESIVLRELEKIARKTNLVTEEPVIEKTASVESEIEDEVSLLESSGDLISDVVTLALALRDRGFVKQASSLEEKAFILKKAMSEGGHNSLYDFWKEEGKAVINFAHKTTDADVNGYKPKNLNEIRDSVLSNLSQQPTGNQDKAIRMAQKVTYLLKKVAQQDASILFKEPKNRELYDKWYNKGDYYNTYIVPMQQANLIDQELNVAPQAISNILSMCMTSPDSLIPLSFIDKDFKTWATQMKAIPENQIQVVLAGDGGARQAQAFFRNNKDWGQYRYYASLWVWEIELADNQKVDFSQINNLTEDNPMKKWKITGQSQVGKSIEQLYRKVFNEENLSKKIQGILGNYLAEVAEFSKWIADAKKFAVMAGYVFRESQAIRQQILYNETAKKELWAQLEPALTMADRQMKFISGMGQTENLFKFDLPTDVMGDISTKLNQSFSSPQDLLDALEKMRMNFRANRLKWSEKYIETNAAAAG